MRVKVCKDLSRAEKKYAKKPWLDNLVIIAARRGDGANQETFVQ
jgi:hypothetical protein